MVSVRAFHILDWLILLIELGAMGLGILIAYLTYISGEPVYVYLTPIVAVLAMLGSLMWNKVWHRVKEELPPGRRSPGTQIFTGVSDSAGRSLAVLIPVRTGICWLVANIFIYYFLLVLLKPIYNSYYYLASGLCFHFLIAGFIAYLIVRRGETFGSLGWRVGDYRTGILLALLFAFLIPASWVVRTMFAGGSFQLVMPQGTAMQIAAVLFLIVVFTPVTEEVMFRGYVQREFQKTMGRATSLFWASLVFALVHIPKIFVATEYLNSPTGTPWLLASISGSAPWATGWAGVLIYIIVFLVVGFDFGVIYRESESVVYPVLSHAVYNFLVTILVLS